MDNIRFDTRRIGDYLDHHADNYPEREAVRDNRQSLTYLELRDKVELCARAMHMADVKAGDRVAVLAQPCIEAWITFLAAAKLGIIWLGLNPKYQIKELDYIVSDAAPSLLFGIDNLEGRNYREDVNQLVHSHKSIQRSIGLESTDFYEIGFTDWMKEHALNSSEKDVYLRRVADVPLDSPMLQVYTSGSSGKPKGVILGQREMLQRSRTQNEQFNVDPFPRVLNPLPINHIGGMHFLSLYAFVGEGTIILSEKFLPDEFIEAMANEEVNIVLLLPTMFQIIAGRPTYNSKLLDNLQWFIFSGAAMPVEFIEQLYKAKCQVGLTYGMTETCGSVTYAHKSGNNREVLLNTIGRSTPDGEVRVVSGDGEKSAPGETGEIQVRAEFCMRHYFNRPDATAEAYTSDGWFKTGDIARMREDGNIEFVGRMSEMFKSGGYNVYPREVELVLEEHPDIQLAAVVGVPDRLYAEVGWAYIIPREGVNLDRDVVKEWCAERLANYKIPKNFIFSEELPMLPVGKVNKSLLKREMPLDLSDLIGKNRN